MLPEGGYLEILHERLNNVNACVEEESKGLQDDGKFMSVLYIHV